MWGEIAELWAKCQKHSTSGCKLKPPADVQKLQCLWVNVGRFFFLFFFFAYLFVLGKCCYKWCSTRKNRKINKFDLFPLCDRTRDSQAWYAKSSHPKKKQTNRKSFFIFPSFLFDYVLELSVPSCACTFVVAKSISNDYNCFQSDIIQLNWKMEADEEWKIYTAYPCTSAEQFYSQKFEDAYEQKKFEMKRGNNVIAPWHDVQNLLILLSVGSSMENMNLIIILPY